MLNGTFNIIAIKIENRLKTSCRELVVIIMCYIKVLMNALKSLKCRSCDWCGSSVDVGKS